VLPAKKYYLAERKNLLYTSWQKSWQKGLIYINLCCCHNSWRMFVG